MFHKTSTKLAALYLAILLIISLGFSSAVYQLSTEEFERSYEHQMTILQRGPNPGLSSDMRNALLQDEHDRYDEARLHVLRRLLLANVFILFAGGFLAYYMARRTLQPIEDSHQALERFTADASHELRTPLAAMRTETEVALMNPKLKLSDAKKQLQSNLEEVLKLTTLSDGLLRLARLEKGELSQQSFAVKSVVDKAMVQVKPLADPKKIALQADHLPELRIQGDVDSIVEVLVILLDNAIKYSPNNTTVRIMAEAEHQSVAVHIIDEGIGMEAAEIKRIFERFYRADSARSKQSNNGYGLGLAIAQDIVALQQGTISAQSHSGKGSTFTITLPRAS